MSVSIFEAYAAGKAGAFFDSHFARVEDRNRARAVTRPIVPALADALDAQNARFAPSAERLKHLRALRSGAAVVVTGQQAGLFLGPLYTLYKCATTIRLAQSLRSEWGAPVVPVFWLQTEDHDLAEIAECHVGGARGDPLSLSLPVPDGSVSISHRVLPAEVADCLRKLGEALTHLPYAEAHLSRMARHYRPGAGWATAFAGVLAELFAEEGLVVLDPRDPALSELAAPVHRRALLQSRSISEALGERVRALAAEGVSVVVHVREAAPLSFFHPDGPAGPRYRLEATAEGFAEVGGTRAHTQAALLDALKRSPATFSTSALLRPILQDTWLPTAAYVGGPAEIGYFAQLAPLYHAFEMPMPLVVPRIRIRLLEDKPLRLLARRHLSADDVCRPFEEALAKARTKESESFERVAPARGSAPSGEDLSRRLLSEFDRSLIEVTAAFRKAGGAIDKALERTRGSVARAVSKLARKYDSARLYQDQALVEDIRRLQGWLYPAGRPQERYFGLSYFAARYGERPFVERTLAAATPFEVAPKDLEL